MRRLALLLAAVVCIGFVAMPAAAQQTETPDDGDANTPEIPVQSPSGSPVTYNSPTPTSGDGPGVGAAGALVAGVLGAVLAVHRRRD